MTFLTYHEPTGYFTFLIKSLGLAHLFHMKPPNLSAIQYGKIGHTNDFSFPFQKTQSFTQSADTTGNALKEKWLSIKSLCQNGSFSLNF